MAKCWMLHLDVLSGKFAYFHSNRSIGESHPKLGDFARLSDDNFRTFPYMVKLVAVTSVIYFHDFEVLGESRPFVCYSFKGELLD